MRKQPMETLRIGRPPRAGWRRRLAWLGTVQQVSLLVLIALAIG